MRFFIRLLAVALSLRSLLATVFHSNKTAECVNKFETRYVDSSIGKLKAKTGTGDDTVLSRATTSVEPVVKLGAGDDEWLTILRTLIREIAHALGFGTIWEDLGLLIDQNGSPRFIGDQATSEYNDIFGKSETSVPVDEGRGHWREDVFGHELMTPVYDSGVINPVSTITAAAMADMRYRVDLTAADDYQPPTRTISAADDVSNLGLL
jgi:hypothetical protein